MELNIFIDNRSDLKIDSQSLELIKKAIKNTLDYEKMTGLIELSLSFVRPEEIRELNSYYRNKDEFTDVLSFPSEMDFDIDVKLLGDIIIDPKKAQMQSEEYCHSFNREISYLTVHSTLHLLGYDHMNDEEKLIMRAKEKEIMKGLYR